MSKGVLRLRQLDGLILDRTRHPRRALAFDVVDREDMISDADILSFRKHGK